MSSISSYINNTLNNARSVNILFCLALLFLCIVKLPSLIVSDMQPWDEGMYALRVLSIHVNGDFIDQSSHSIGGFYSGSHPPLLIWIGYLGSLISGLNETTLKFIVFLFSLGSLYLLYRLCVMMFDHKTALFSVFIFSSTIIFNIFSKRFQLDFPYTFFIILSVYLFVKFNSTSNRKYLFAAGISFGLCLMTKILVGVFIPIVILASYFFIKNKVNYGLKDIVLLTLTGVVIAVPWHLYITAVHGNEFIEYFIGFHIVDRAVEGVEQNYKASGILYYINYLFNIIPFSILIFYSLYLDSRNFKLLNWKKIFLWGWFVSGFVILTFFKTKLEVYVLVILPPAVILLADFILYHEFKSFKEKTAVFMILLFNLIWFFTDDKRQVIKDFITNSDKLILLLILFATVILMFGISYMMALKLKPGALIKIYVVLFFLLSNLNFAINVHSWENTFVLSEIKEFIDEDKRDKLIFITSNYRFNPQFSYYFEGADIGWERSKYNIKMLDTKNGTEIIKQNLQNINEPAYIIVERDKINRADYPETELFIPVNFHMVHKTTGYELFSNQ